MTNYRREAKLPTIRPVGKAEVGRVRKEKKEVRRSEKTKRERRKKMQVRKKVGQSRFIVFFPMICGSRWSKGRLAKAADAEAR